MTQQHSPSESAVARARGAAYSLLSHAFHYPDAALLRALASPARWSSWPGILRQVAGGTAEAMAAVRTLFQSRSIGAKKLEPSSWLEAYSRLFGHAVRGRCPPYELEYGRSEIIQQASILADITGFYTAFGMEVDRCANERADHITVESEFMGVLCAREASAIEEGHGEHLDVTVTAQRDFLKDHLACWLPAFLYRMERADACGPYGLIARLGSRLIAAECERFAIRIGPRTLEINPADPVLDRTVACGSAGNETHCETGEPLVQLTVD